MYVYIGSAKKLKCAGGKAASGEQRPRLSLKPANLLRAAVPEARTIIL